MSNIIGIELEDLQDLMRVAVRNEIETCLQECRFGTEFKDEIWDRKKVADFFNVTPETITDKFKKNEIPGKKIGSEYFFLKSQIIGLFKKGK
jgi:hypothetical protein